MKFLETCLCSIFLLVFFLNQSISFIQYNEGGDGAITNGDGNINWKNVVSFDESTIHKCSNLCGVNLGCSMWLIDSNSNNRCFIISSELSKNILSLYKDQLIADNKSIQFGFSKPTIQIDRLVGDALPFSSTSLYNQRQHFSYGCKYTISLWAWFWKGRLNMPKDTDTLDRVIFSTRPITDLYLEDAYQPSILFNLRVDQRLLQEDSIFFSASKDENGDYVGFRPSGAFVRYHEWMHIMLSLDGGILSAFIDGKLMGQVNIFDDNKPKFSVCPYLDEHEKYKNSSEHFNFSSSLRNNTILQMFGHRPVHDVSTDGMIQDFVVIRNFAVNDSETATAIMNHRIPETPYQLTLMLRSLDIYTLEGFSPMAWEFNPYLMKAWKVCPQSVCGNVCLDPRFLLGVLTNDMGAQKCRATEHVWIREDGTQEFSYTVNLHHYVDLMHLFPPTLRVNFLTTSSANDCASKCTVLAKEATGRLVRDLFYAGFYWYLGDGSLGAKINVENCGDLNIMCNLEELKKGISEHQRKTKFYRNISEISQNWSEKRLNAKKAWVAFTLALWMTDDIYERTTEMQIPWSYPYPVESQPAHLALAFLHGVDNRNLNDALQPIRNHYHSHHVYSKLSQSYEYNCYDGLLDSLDKLAEFTNRNTTILSCELLDPKRFAPTLFDFIRFIENSDAASLGAGDDCRLRDASTASINTIHTIDRTCSLMSNSLKFQYYGMHLNNTDGKNIKNLISSNDFHEINMQIDEIKATFSGYHQDIKGKDQFQYSNAKSRHRYDPKSDTLSCMASASFLFPVTQYVASHYGVDNNGITIPENLLLSDGNLDKNSHMSNSDLYIHWNHDANVGSVEALLFMGRRFFWGLSGETVNHAIARKWFEMAAKKDDPEGLYNIGIMHLHGQGGLNVNVQQAFWYLNRSAHGASQRRPFASALHALGNLYLTPEYSDYYNETKAREAFKLAAQMDCSYGHFSYAMLLREENDIAGTLIHLGRASTLGNLRAINYLAHALYDQESWLYHTSAMINKTILESKYNATVFAMYVGETYIEIPWPIINHRSCQIALVLLKHISSYAKGYSIKHLNQSAYALYRQGDYLNALQKFNSLMLLGDITALRNSIFILETLRDRVCPSIAKGSTFSSSSNDGNEGLTTNWQKILEQLMKYYKLFRYHFEHQKQYVFFDKLNIEMAKYFTTVEQCNNYFDDSIISGWILLLKDGDLNSPREIYDRATMKKYSFDVYFENHALPKMLHSSFLNGEVDAITYNLWDIYIGNYNFAKNSSLVRSLFRELLSLDKRQAIYFHNVLKFENFSKPITINATDFEDFSRFEFGFISVLDLIVHISICITHICDAFYSSGFARFWVLLKIILGDGIVQLCLFLLSLMGIQYYLSK